MERKKIKLHNVFNDGCELFSFVFVNETSAYKIAYAFTDRNGETHTEIYELAVEDGFLREEREPSGGGVYDARTGEYLRPSFHYGEAKSAILEFLDRRIKSLSDC